MRHLLLTVALLAIPLPTPAAPAWTLLHGNGAPATLADLGKALRGADVVFFGEQHDDPRSHQFEALLLQQALKEAAPERTVTLSLEMFERDVQPVLDEYLTGLIREEDFLAASRPWPNYKTDYRPLVEFARTHHLPVLAANAPKRYASRASRLGLASLNLLPATSRAWLAPWPVPAPSKAFTTQFNRFLEDAAGHGAPHMADGQVLRDATMAHAIADHARRHPRAVIVHLNGAFHSEGGIGTPEMLARYAPRLKPLIITANGRSRSDDFIVRTAR